MISHLLMPLAVAMIPQSAPVNSFYNYGAHLTYTYGLTALPTPTDQSQSCFIDGNITFNCDLSYDDSESYYLNNITFSYNLAIIYYDINSNRPDIDSTLNGTLNTNWEITPSSYYQQFDEITWFIGIDNTDDLFYQRFTYPGNTYLRPINILTGVYTDLPFDAYPSSYIELKIDANVLFQYVDYYTSSVSSTQIETIYSDGYSNGYTDGFNEGSSVDRTAITVFNGILNIGLVPINFFLAMFNFEVLGINISQLVSSILSICLVIIVVRFVTGKSSDGGA